MTDVLLYSGGLDSYVLNHLEEPDKRLLFDIGTEESKKEARFARKTEFEVEIIDGIELDQFALDNDIIPHRNTIFALLASNYGDMIYLGATKGDTTKDKDHVWGSQVEQLLNYFGKDEEKTPVDEYPYEVKMPFKDMTKTDIVEAFLDAGGDPARLARDSRSCYNGAGNLECGECRSCIRKAIAFKLNDAYSFAATHFEEYPFSNVTEDDHQKMLRREGEAEDYRRLLDEYPRLIDHE